MILDSQFHGDLQGGDVSVGQVNRHHYPMKQGKPPLLIK
jgi:hypothetical protein